MSTVRFGSRWVAALACAVLGVGCAKPSVLVVGLDGANWAVLDPLIDAGHLPTIGGLIRSGARADLDCVPVSQASACYCPPVWTSIATGRTQSEHQFRTFFTPSYERQFKAIWNLVDEAGGIVTTAAYRGTWPPEPGMEFVFTEPGLDVLGSELFESWDAFEHPGALEPETLYAPQDLPTLLGLVPHEAERPPSWGILSRDRAAMTGLLSLVYARGPESPETAVTELTMIVIDGPDKTAHLYWSGMQEEMYGPIDPTPLLAGADAWDGPVYLPGPLGFGPMAGPYLEADEWLARLLAARDYDFVVFVSDHGMTRNPGSGLSGSHGVDSPEAHHGIFAVAGPGVKAGWLEEISALDVAPTLAYLLDLPVAEDLPGRVIEEAFTSVRLALWPVKRVPTWEE